MEHIKLELDKHLKRNGLYTAAESSNVCNVFEEIKGNILDKDIVCKVCSFKNNILKLSVPSSILSTEVKLRAELIKKELNKKLSKNMVSRVEVIVKS